LVPNREQTDTGHSHNRKNAEPRDQLSSAAVNINFSREAAFAGRSDTNLPSDGVMRTSVIHRPSHG